MSRAKTAIIKKSASKLGKAWNGISIGAAVLGGVSEFNDAKREGYGTGMAAGRAIGTYILDETIGLPMMGAMWAVRNLPNAVVSAGDNLSRMSRDMTSKSAGGAFSNANFIDTQQAYTMRQAGMQMAKASQYNLQQSMMGNEASFMHL